jgi:heterotetrameric sarcosine oxidase gamma subunit
MSDPVWTDSLSAPRSLATRGETGIAVIEDPGVIELCLGFSDRKTADKCAKLLGTELPESPWQTVSSGTLRLVWVGVRRWRIFGDRERVEELGVALGKKAGWKAVFDLTGAFACFRVVGATADEILMRVCPLDTGSVEKDQARGTSIAGVKSLLVRENAGSWVALTPRSYAQYVGGALAEAARTPGRLALFAPAKPPPV